MMIDDEKLLAYADGELEEGERIEVERALATDPALADKLARHRALASRLSAAMQRELSEPVPERLLRTARTSPAGAAVVTTMAPRRRPGVHGGLARWSALAASFAFGAIGAALWLRTANDSVLALQHGRLSARGDLAEALTYQLAAGAKADAHTQVGMSFKDHEGHYCRTFSIRDRAATAGLACRDATGWAVAAVAPVAMPEETNGRLRMASSPMPNEILQAIDSRIVGEALDANAEKQAQARGWRN